MRGKVREAHFSRPVRSEATMGRMVDVDDIVGPGEIAQRLRVSQTSMIHHWRRRDPSFPEPLFTRLAGSFWLWPEVERWARSTGRL